MSIDMKDLRRTAGAGKPDDKVMVSRRWLAEVHRELSKQPADPTGGLAKIFDVFFNGRRA